MVQLSYRAEFRTPDSEVALRKAIAKTRIPQLDSLNRPRVRIKYRRIEPGFRLVTAEWGEIGSVLLMLRL
jgi:hypothetical protein